MAYANAVNIKLVSLCLAHTDMREYGICRTSPLVQGTQIPTGIVDMPVTAPCYMCTVFYRRFSWCLVYENELV
jgi:hypothetical protein